ncbi:WRKY transcription factor 22-like [Vigna umbellata]|uniref:WRKY transcription factor 22-like n=1 Tax=Vigna umbellata TaxID=87088 RepID=UPI001F5F72C4|nr:WRKY transcription factor 22-like [Vigna umbellata]
MFSQKTGGEDKSDPTMFIVTYTGEHDHPAPTHKSSLAGSTRYKPQTGGDTTTTKPVSPATSSEVAQHSTKSECIEEELEDLMKDDEEANEFDSTETVVSDDFFEGLEELTGSAIDPFTAIVTIERLVTGHTATTIPGGGGGGSGLGKSESRSFLLENSTGNGLVCFGG